MHTERLVRYNDASGVILFIQHLLNAKIASNVLMNTL